MNLDDTTTRLAARIGARARTADGQTLDHLLADELPGKELNTLLLHCLRRRALGRSFVDVLEHAERTPMFAASTADVRRLRAFDDCAFEEARDFEAVELSPVLPLGATAGAGVDPNNVLGAVRFAEAAADPAVGLALHAALARRSTGEPRRWCTSQRVLRLQPTSVPGFTPHFRLFALLSAARSESRGADLASEHRLLAEQLLVWARLFGRALPGARFRIAALRVVLADTEVVRACLRACGVDGADLARTARAHVPGSTEAALAGAGVVLPRATRDPVSALAELGIGKRFAARMAELVANVGAPLAAAHPEVEVVYDLARLQGLAYYDGPYIQLVIRHDDGWEVPIGDGGALGWIGAMLSNRRERTIVTGAGTEACVKLFDQKDHALK
jgi:hypothetical protein